MHRNLSATDAAAAPADAGGDADPPGGATEAAGEATPLTPRYVAAVTPLAREVRCGRCGAELAGETAPRVFEDLAPICDGCARQRAPELAGFLG